MLVKTMPNLKIPNLLDRAMTAHREGELGFAKSLYSEILSTQSKHYDAMHMLGILLFQEGKFKQANELLKSAQEINAKDPRLLYNLGLVRYELEAYEEAVCYYLESLSINMPFLPKLISPRLL